MKKGEKRKQELLKIAYKMFLTKGYENTSVDEIIEEAGIAKGTYYYYFESKEQMLEEVIEMMIGQEAEVARQVLNSGMDMVQKILGIMAAFRPTQEETTIENALHQQENALMHNKVKKRLMAAAIPLLAEAAEEGNRQGIFCCDHVPERVKLLLIVGNELFDEESFTESDVAVFIDMAEKLLGAKAGSMDYIKGLIGQTRCKNGEKE